MNKTKEQLKADLSALEKYYSSLCNREKEGILFGIKDKENLPFIIDSLKRQIKEHDESNERTNTV